MLRSVVRRAVPVVMALSLVVMQAAPVGAAFRPGSPPGGVRRGSNTELTLSATGPGQGVTGFIANPADPFDPVASGYPTSDPTSGFTPRDESFAGVIHATPTSGGPVLDMYCIDILTETFVGIGYHLGTWDSANVPNVGYVARILNEYYPNTDQPAALTDLNQKAAAVQAAIWFFSDRYVLSTSDPLRPTVAAIATKIIAEGPLVQPPPPSLSITPTSLSGPAGSILGPYTVTSTVGQATVTAIGAQMFSDAAATIPVAGGATVGSGTQIWLKSTGPAGAVLQATAQATVPGGNVYLYDGNSSITDAQKLILAQTATLTTTVSATGEFLALGSLVVNKTIAGPAAGSQGQVTIHVVCNGNALTPDFVIPAGTAAGTQTHTYSGIPAGSICTVDETADGSTSTVEVTITGDGQQVTIPAGGAATANLTDTYSHAPGSLVVNKSIAGPAAGSQGQVTIHVVCNGNALAPDFVIPAGTPASEQSHVYEGIPAGSSCTVTETADGSSSTVTVTVTGSPQTVTVPAGQIVEANLTDTYDFVPGSLVVTKTIAGPAASHQGQVVIHVECDGTALTPDFVIPAGTAAGTESHTYLGIPANSVCTITETADGSTSAVTVTVTGDGQTVTIPPNGMATADLNDAYEFAPPGSLDVKKTIAGPAAGSQGQVTISVVCNGNALAPFVIPAGTPASEQFHVYDGIPAGSSCTVTETADGSSSTVTVTITGGNPQTVVVPAGGSGNADFIDTYDFVPGSLKVNKTIEGPAAGQQGPVTIAVICRGRVLTPVFVIPADTPAGTVSHTYDNIPGGSKCLVVELIDGRIQGTVTVTVTGRLQPVTVPAGGTATADVTDTYSHIPGSLLVSKTIEGPLAGQQGPVTIHVVCNGTALTPDFVIPAGTAAGTVSHGFDGIAAGSACTVTETADGATSTVTVTVEGNGQRVTVPAGTEVPVALADTYTDAPGSLRVTKTLAGAAAGQQGQVAMLVLCGGPIRVFAFLIPVGTPGGPVPRTYDGIPAGSTCTVLEVVDGRTSTVTVVGAGSGQRVTVPAGGTASADLTDTFSAASLTTIPATGAGAPTPGLIGIALAAIVAGGVMVAGGRRRRIDHRGRHFKR